MRVIKQTLSLALAGTLMCGLPLAAQPAESPEADGPFTEEIVVTGLRRSETVLKHRQRLRQLGAEELNAKGISEITDIQYNTWYPACNTASFSAGVRSRYVESGNSWRHPASW